MESAICFACQKPLDLPPGEVGRRETCGACGVDVRVCKNCEHYDPSAYNECRETAAERIVNKDKSNFCDYFRIRFANDGKSGKLASSTKDDIVRQLDDLFKK